MAIAAAQGKELITAEGANHTKVWIRDRRNVGARRNEINEITAKKIIQHFDKED